MSGSLCTVCGRGEFKMAGFVCLRGQLLVVVVWQREQAIAGNYQISKCEVITIQKQQNHYIFLLDSIKEQFYSLYEVVINNCDHGNVNKFYYIKH